MFLFLLTNKLFKCYFRSLTQNIRFPRFNIFYTHQNQISKYKKGYILHIFAKRKGKPTTLPSTLHFHSSKSLFIFSFVIISHCFGFFFSQILYISQFYLNLWHYKNECQHFITQTKLLNKPKICLFAISITNHQFRLIFWMLHVNPIVCIKL